MRISDWSSDVCSSDLFAVPAVEAMGVLLLPQMLAARDLPFPRLSDFAFWAYLVGGLVFFTTIFFGASPDGGRFMFSPGTDERRVGKDWCRSCRTRWSPVHHTKKTKIV